MGNEKNQVWCGDARREGDGSTWHAQGTSVFTGFYTVGMGGEQFHTGRQRSDRVLSGCGGRMKKEREA